MNAKKIQIQDFPKKFPNGEVHVRLASPDYVRMPEHHHSFLIEKQIRNSDDIMEILLLADATRRMYGPKKIEMNLSIPYVPYSRQDRVMVDGESLSIKVFCDLINTAGFDNVFILDPHSDVTPALLNNCRVLPQEVAVVNNIHPSLLRDYVLVCPDAGARKKILKLSERINNPNIVYADKVRNPATGQITGTTINYEGVPQLSGELGSVKFLIVDDICEGGRTFIEISKQLKKRFICEVYLFVSHGFFSAGMEVLRPHFNKIYVANLMNESVKGDELLSKGKYE